MPDDSVSAKSESEDSGPRSPRVTAQYSMGYEPPFDITPVIKRMVETVPAKYLVGLSEIVLTNADGLSRARRRSVTKSRKKKVKTRTARGVYHPAWEGKQAWIEIFVDNTLRPWEKGLWLKFPFIREMDLREVLFHEIGHHIHFAVRPEYREKEDVADVWKVRLERNYDRRRFSLLKILFRFIRLFAGPVLDWLDAKVTKHLRQKGVISQAEFEEHTRGTIRN